MKKNLNKLATLALTGILMTGMSFGSLAATSTTNGIAADVAGETELVLKKEMKIVDVDDPDYNDDVAAPGVSYTYTIEPATVADNTVKNGVPVKAGHTGAKIKDGTSTTFTTNDRASSGIISRDITVDFLGVEWTEPGIYRYELSEAPAVSTQNNYSYEKALKDDTTNCKRYIDVYVGYYEENGKEELGIIGYAVSYTDSGEKTNGYEVVEDKYGAVYSAYDVKVTKHVTGNLGNKSGNFAFKGSVDMATGASYGYAKNANNVAARSGGISETLNNNEYFTVKGVPVGHAVTASETSYADEGYTTTVKVNGTELTKDQYTAGESVTSGDNGEEGVSTVEFTNDRKNTTPTGVVMNIAPYAAMILGAGAFAGVFLGRKKSEDEE